MRAIDRKLVRDLWHARGQALAIALVVGAGVAMFVLMLSTFESLGLTERAYYERYRFGDVFASLTRAPRSLERDIARIPGVATAQLRVVVDVTLDVPGQDAPIGARLISIPDEGPPVLNGVFLRSGRWVEGYRDDEVIASENFALANHLHVGDPVDAIINGRRSRLRIVGLGLSPEYVYAIRPGELVADDARFAVMWMGRKALSTAFRMEGAFNDVSLAVGHGASVPEVIARLDRLLVPYGGLGAIPRERQLSHFFLQSEIDSLRGLGQMAPVIFLGVAAFLLNVVLTRLLAVERPQIAALKALGYSNAQVGAHYVSWAVIVGAGGAALGTLAGAVMGRGMTALYTDFFHFPVLQYRLPAAVVVEGLAIAAMAATAGALGAVRRGVALPPAEAMRPAPPARFTVSWPERAGLRRWMSQPARIVIRNLARHPARAALSVVAIAFAGALLIVGTFTIDSMNVVTDAQFEMAQRYDAMVTFVTPRSAGAGDDVRRMAGVIDAEGFRVVPARVRAGPRVRTVAIAGLADSSRLMRVVDAAVAVVTLPPDGLVLSTALARRLEVVAGDTVSVEVLEGERPTRRVVVSRLVDEYMGTNAYMNIEALHRLMREGGTLSGAYLQVDEAASAMLYRQLKQTPAVAGVAVRQAAVDSFRRTLAESVRLMRVVTVLFAAIIAFGVVYNTARIALSERGAELATLRVMGYTRPEVASILMGELALVTAAALPLSMVIGYGLAAATVRAFDTDVYRLPLIVTARTCAVSMLTTVATAVASACIVRRRLDRLDLLAVLKTRE
jgi:putative ABC transport system permease protein